MLVVQKFGGTSVGSLEKIKSSCEIVKNTILQGKKVVVIVSAMAGETDRLLELYSNLLLDVKETRETLQEKDAILSTGEQVCAGLFASFLNVIGIKARSFNGIQAGIFTDDAFSNAKIESVNLEEVNKAMFAGYTPVITGFQGFYLKEGRQTTLGRGGSDTSAIAIASKLNAESCEIYKDVDGVLTGDPKIIKNTKKITDLDYKTMLEITSSGAKVLETRSVNFATKYGIPIAVLSSFSKTSGTKISNKTSKERILVNEKAKIENISFSQNHAFCRFSSKRTISEEIKHLNLILPACKIISFENVEKNFQNETIFNVLTTINQAKQLKCNMEEVIQISIIGYFLKSDNVLERAIKLIEKFPVLLVFTAISETKISIFLHKTDASEILNLLHAEFIS